MSSRTPALKQARRAYFNILEGFETKFNNMKTKAEVASMYLELKQAVGTTITNFLNKEGGRKLMHFTMKICGDYFNLAYNILEENKLYDAKYNFNIYSAFKEVFDSISVNCSEFSGMFLNNLFTFIVRYVTGDLETADYRQRRNLLFLFKANFIQLTIAEQISIIESDDNLMRKMANMIFECGDYSMQVSILEMLLVSVENEKRSHLYSKWFEKYPQVLEDIMNVNKYSRSHYNRAWIRTFLVKVNDSEELKNTTSKVYNVPCIQAYAGCFKLEKPTDPEYRKFWVDFSQSLGTICIDCTFSKDKAREWRQIIIEYVNMKRIINVNEEKHWKLTIELLSPIEICFSSKVKSFSTVTLYFEKTEKFNDVRSYCLNQFASHIFKEIEGRRLDLPETSRESSMSPFSPEYSPLSSPSTPRRNHQPSKFQNKVFTVRNNIVSQVVQNANEIDNQQSDSSNDSISRNDFQLGNKQTETFDCYNFRANKNNFGIEYLISASTIVEQNRNSICSHNDSLINNRNVKMNSSFKRTSKNNSPAKEINERGGNKRNSVNIGENNLNTFRNRNSNLIETKAQIETSGQKQEEENGNKSHTALKKANGEHHVVQNSENIVEKESYNINEKNNQKPVRMKRMVNNRNNEKKEVNNRESKTSYQKNRRNNEEIITDKEFVGETHISSSEQVQSEDKTVEENEKNKEEINENRKENRNSQESKRKDLAKNKEVVGDNRNENGNSQESKRKELAKNKEVVGNNRNENGNSQESKRRELAKSKEVNVNRHENGNSQESKRREIAKNNTVNANKKQDNKSNKETKIPQNNKNGRRNGRSKSKTEDENKNSENDETSKIANNSNSKEKIILRNSTKTDQKEGGNDIVQSEKKLDENGYIRSYKVDGKRKKLDAAGLNSSLSMDDDDDDDDDDNISCSNSFTNDSESFTDEAQIYIDLPLLDDGPSTSKSNNKNMLFNGENRKRSGNTNTNSKATNLSPPKKLCKSNSNVKATKLSPLKKWCRTSTNSKATNRSSSNRLRRSDSYGKETNHSTPKRLSKVVSKSNENPNNISKISPNLRNSKTHKKNNETSDDDDDEENIELSQNGNDYLVSSIERKLPSKTYSKSNKRSFLKVDDRNDEIFDRIKNSSNNSNFDNEIQVANEPALKKKLFSSSENDFILTKSLENDENKTSETNKQPRSTNNSCQRKNYNSDDSDFIPHEIYNYNEDEDYCDCTRCINIYRRRTEIYKSKSKKESLRGLPRKNYREIETSDDGNSVLGEKIPNYSNNRTVKNNASSMTFLSPSTSSKNTTRNPYENFKFPDPLPEKPSTKKGQCMLECKEEKSFNNLFMTHLSTFTSDLSALGEDCLGTSLREKLLLNDDKQTGYHEDVLNTAKNVLCNRITTPIRTQRSLVEQSQSYLSMLAKTVEFIRHLTDLQANNTNMIENALELPITESEFEEFKKFLITNDYRIVFKPENAFDETAKAYNHRLNMLLKKYLESNP